ncbi:cell division transport system permease protein [Alteribacillus persepolensis]|uniref:Cell division protein FtsX n=1 Tax=Alteribacillus persepolensis TaxID=568899 RepID=A0A1G8AHC5_9BACI|nr:permease-like cell division protein FtsX [Alteribacillus persepolensis]SDH20362.1 cell division transport system permease protein [Alteribacillus persepolensis]
MKGRTLVRHGKEGLKNLGRNGWMSFASISAVTIMLIVVGVFLALILNMNHFMSSVEEDVEVRVYVDLTATEEEQKELEQHLHDLEQVERVTYLDKDEGLDQLINSLAEEDQEAFESLRDENPLNDAFILEAEEPQLTEHVAQQAEQLPHIDRVDYGEQVVEQLFNVTSVMRTIGIVLVIGLMFTSMFLISNTIKLTIVSRQKEIQIMKLVGATNGFIRWPFFVEGLLLGVLGSVIPIAAVVSGYSYLYTQFGERLSLDFAELLPAYPLMLQVSLVLLGIGALIGVWGSLMSVRKFLKV